MDETKKTPVHKKSNNPNGKRPKKKKIAEKETRIMRVTMNKSDFENFDMGITHSKAGIRNNAGRMSAQPDIAPIKKSDLPCRTIIRERPVYVEKKRDNRFTSALAELFSYCIIEVASDPEIQQAVKDLALTYWQYKFVPWASSKVKSLKRKAISEINAKNIAQRKEKIVQAHTMKAVACNGDKKYVVSGKEAEAIIKAAQEDARQLSAMIFLLFNSVVKDEKTQEEFLIEKSYIKQLLSDESKHSMMFLVQNKGLIDIGTKQCFEEFLNGYLSIEGKHIPIPAIEDEKE